MRITSGILGGRQFNVPKNGVRPTTERTREAVFSSLVAHVPNARVLDLFAGAGSLGLEAWSRGAASVTAVENDSRAWKNLQKTFQALETGSTGGPKVFQGSEKQMGAGSADFQGLEHSGLGSYEVIRADAYSFCKRVWDPYDLIFADPPYDEVDLPRLLESIGKALAPDGLLVFELRGRDPYSVPDGWAMVRDKKYGSTRIIFLERTP